MSSSPEFVEHAVDLLSLLGPVEARRMFGGHGVYAEGVMFAVLDDDELFLKTDDLCRERFEAAGCRRWSFVMKGERIETAYFRPPDEAHEDPEAMLPWARLALDCALRKAAARARPARRPARPAPAAEKPRAKAKARAKPEPRAKARPARRASRPRSR